MRPERRPEQVGRVVRPATQSRIASLIASFSVRLPRLDADDGGAEQPHADDVQRLPRHVLGPHVDDALEAEQRAGGRRRDAVLTGAGLGDDAGLAHPLGEQRLADGVVDLVRAGVGQVLALEEHAAADVVRQPLRLVERRRAADELPQHLHERLDEGAIRRGRRSRPARAPPPARPASRARTARRRRRSSRARRDRAGRTPALAVHSIQRHCHPASTRPRPRARTRACALTDFSPGRVSIPEETSTAYGRTIAIASPTLSAVNPPAKTSRRVRASTAAAGQSASWPVPPGASPVAASTSSVTSSSQAAACGQQIALPRQRLDHARPRRRGVRRRLAAMELHRVEPDAPGNRPHVGRRHIDEDADALQERRQPPADGARRLGRDRARARRREHEADRIGAAVGRGQGVLDAT